MLGVVLNAALLSRTSAAVALTAPAIDALNASRTADLLEIGGVEPAQPRAPRRDLEVGGRIVVDGEQIVVQRVSHAQRRVNRRERAEFVQQGQRVRRRRLDEDQAQSRYAGVRR
ncbi:MAG: hypothetical protein HND48_22410 [Chloroflexi bacterium]|nr:hypothetical protein [Chloroflexota bacterium]